MVERGDIVPRAGTETFAEAGVGRATMMSKEDHLDFARPRPNLNLDVVRCLVKVPTIAALKPTLDALQAQLGISAQELKKVVLRKKWAALPASEREAYEAKEGSAAAGALRMEPGVAVVPRPDLERKRGRRGHSSRTSTSSDVSNTSRLL